MRNSLLSAVAAASLVMVVSPALAKGKGGTWVAAVPVTGSTSMSVFGINNTNIVTGEYVDSSGLQHGFIGPFAGSNYTSFDDPGGVTEPRGINDSDITDGYDTGTLDEWYRSAKGTLTPITKGKNTLTQVAQGINSAGDFVGNYDNAKGTSLGYMGAKSKYKSAIKLSITNSGYAGRGIDTAGDVAGWYYDSSTVQHGYLIMGGKATTIDYPNAAYTVIEGINDNGYLSGQWESTSGVLSGFVYDISTKKFTSLTAPQATTTQAWGINNNNVVAVSSTAGSFVYCMTKKGCPKASGGAVHTWHVAAKFTPAAP